MPGRVSLGEQEACSLGSTLVCLSVWLESTLHAFSSVEGVLNLGIMEECSTR